MSEWPLAYLGDLIYHKKGFAFKSSAYSDEGVLVVRVSDTTNSSIDIKTCKRIPQKMATQFKDYELHTDDIVIMTVGSWPDNQNSVVGKVVKVPSSANNALLNQNAVRIRNRSQIDQSFLYYTLKNRAFSGYIVNNAQGSANQASITLEDIFSFQLNIPPLLEQKAIASVLSSLDDKIDLLHRQNKTLEAMAETLFRQWFVEQADEGWKAVSLGNINLAKIIKSGIDKFEGEKIYLATGDVNDTEIIGGNKIEYKKRPSRANIQPVKYSVWFAKKGGVRKLLMFDNYSEIDNIILSTGFTGLKTTELSHYYIWCYILTQEFQEIKDSFVSGSVQPDINNDGVLQIMMLNPDEESLKKFNEIVRPLFTKIQANNNQIRTLEKLRDTLLSKLMSGEVRLEYEDN